MRRIAFITTELGTGGAEVFLVDLLRSLRQQGVHPLVISLRRGGSQAGKLRCAGIPVRELGVSGPLSFLGSARAVRGIVREFEAEAVQGWMYHGNIAATRACGQSRLPVFWSVHHSLADIRQEKPALRAVIHWSRRLSHTPSAIQYCSRASERQHGRFGFRSDHGVVIPNGFDCARFHPRPDQVIPARQRLGFEADDQLIGHIGRYAPMKDHANFLRAAARLHSKRPDVRFVLIGRRVDEHNDVLRQLRRDLGLNGVVRFLGERNDVSSVVHGLSVLSTSSAWGEAFPIVLGEAMAAGIPCVATDLGDCRYLLGDTGPVVPPRNASQLAHAWLTLVNEREADRRERIERARRRIVDNFSLEAVARRFLDMYGEAVHAA